MSNTFDLDSRFPKFLVFQLIDCAKNTADEIFYFKSTTVVHTSSAEVQK